MLQHMCHAPLKILDVNCNKHHSLLVVVKEEEGVNFELLVMEKQQKKEKEKFQLLLIVPHAYDSAFASLQFQYLWPLVFEGFPEDRPASASKSHSQAEKRRRDRINAQLATLRKLIPKSDKMDKAALLGSVVDHVKDLK
ncbi:hypothetical protein Ahy_A07g032169 [Arachis hypogaea]|uniref:BHLH domain-containing protein n=1 Tax=Arachis hypogaea TaxID=3818 RepID=A0A445C6C6_ARAHY|nr:hypothetical protein Ahy_A07g032169 [Arachis hypogaea]